MASFRPSIATMSLGRPGTHSLHKKLEHVAKDRFEGIELYWDDFHLFTLQSRGSTTTQDYLVTAEEVRRISGSLGLTIVSLQPFRNFEGTLDPEQRLAAIEEFRLWLDIASSLGTRCIGVPSTIVADGHTGDLDVLVRDLKEIASLAAEHSPPINVAYENLCFGAYIQTWQQAYEIVEMVEMPNFGFLPDTFNICVSVWADPASPTGMAPNASEMMKQSMAEFRRTVSSEKIFLLQVADGEKLDEPLVDGHKFHVAGQSPRMSYSRNARCFPFEPQGYLPIMEVIDAVTDVGYVGWASMEIFSHTTQTNDVNCTASHSDRARCSWDLLRPQMISVATTEEGYDSDGLWTLTSRLSGPDTDVDCSSGASWDSDYETNGLESKDIGQGGTKG